DDPPIPPGSIPGPVPGPSSSASGRLYPEQPTPSPPLSEVGFPSCAPGNAEPSTFNGVWITSSLKGSWINTISLDREPRSGENELPPTAPRHRLHLDCISETALPTRPEMRRARYHLRSPEEFLFELIDRLQQVSLH